MRIIRIGPFHLNADLLKLTAGTTPLSVGPKVVETLLALVELGPEAATKEALIARIWPDGFTGEPNLSQNIYVLRKLFREHGFPSAIETETGVGYRLAIAATPMALAPARTARVVFAIAATVACLCVALAFVALDRSRPAQSSTIADSQRLYSIGRYYWNLRSRESVRKSLDYFTQAIDRDPGNARAYAAMADANVTMGDYCYGTHQPSVYFSRAEQYANEALLLDARAAEAHASLGFIRLHQGRALEAARELRTAIALNASYAPAHEWYGIALMERGDLDRGRAQLGIAAKLDPLSVAAIVWLASAAYSEHRYRDAILYSTMALELSPARMDALAIIGQSYAALGNIAAATSAFARYASVSPYYRPEAAAMLALAEARTRRLADAQRQYVYARDHAGDVDDVDLAAAAKALGDYQYAQEIDRKRVAHKSWNAIENAHRFAVEEDLRAASETSVL